MLSSNKGSLAGAQGSAQMPLCELCCGRGQKLGRFGVVFEGLLPRWCALCICRVSVYRDACANGWR